MAGISPDVSSWPTLARGSGKLARTWLDRYLVPLVAFPARAKGGCKGLTKEGRRMREDLREERTYWEERQTEQLWRWAKAAGLSRRRFLSLLAGAGGAAVL